MTKKTLMDELEEIEESFKKNKHPVQSPHEEIIIPRKYKSKYEAKYEIFDIED
jgi:hypothetical protein